ncbi:MAG: protein-L-isoaspartate(D-aspartate) O-methyltransferase [Zoogloeaceae bacterium]|jgi:protein-L-isoaspartate(D-aspartate) O-methyltransferase|nr:protein-L-isoaspartate(D-aspartate) O-methyltransferase [Zoogloeaceae bacterium]
MNARLSGIGMTSSRTRAHMVDRLRQQGIKNESVLAAMNEVPRHIFVAEALAHRAYEDTPLPIGCKQTISQPYIVARMIEALLEGRSSLGRTLEIGTGCGYQAAVLGCLTREIYSVERIARLLDKARNNLADLPDLRHIRLRHADGSLGLPTNAPFDSIIVAAVTAKIPQSLCNQLAPGGILVLPVGESEQYLYRIRRTAQRFVEEPLEAVRFVPLLTGLEK